MRTLRRRVLRPTEGVFLFHPRVMERLVRRDRGRGWSSLAIPSLPHYLMRRPLFLRSLEDENPDALAVIEGLSLPEWIILLPTPADQELEAVPPEQLLRRYWGRRFEAEVARAWQSTGEFGGAGLQAQIGASAWREVRALLEQDQRVVLGLNDDALCRQFVGFTTYLRYFAPGTRAYYFPSIANWDQLDQWLQEGGLDLPPPRHSRRLPQLLVQSCPSGLHINPDDEPELPIRLPFGRHDPDLADGANTILPLASKLSSTRGVAQPVVQIPPALATAVLEKVEAQCREALNQSATPHPQCQGDVWLHNRLLQWLGRSLGVWADRLERFSLPWSWLVRLHLQLFRQNIRAAFSAEMGGRYGTALRCLCSAMRHYQTLQVAETPGAALIQQHLRARQREVAAALIKNLSVTWQLSSTAARVLETWVQRLLNEREVGRWSSIPSRLLDDLERLNQEGRTEYYQLQPWAWLSSLGRKPLQCSLPFQGSLKALRVLNAAKVRLDQLPWSGAEVAWFSAPLQALDERISQRLRQPLLSRLSNLLDEVGFVPTNHAQRIARNLLQEELCETILRRWHLLFPDVRDAISRNILRLRDSGWRELLCGDRLARFDRAASRALPGIYQPGEFYLKGLQQLSALLFGWVPGRLLTRFLLLPFGVAFLALEALTYLLNLMPWVDAGLRLMNLGSLLGAGLALLVMLHTQAGRNLWRTLGYGSRFLWRSMRAGVGWLLGWRLMVHWLKRARVRKLLRYLFEPALIGLMLSIPSVSLANHFAPQVVGLPTFLLILGFIAGAFLRNSRDGRQLLDRLTTRIITFWYQVRSTLIVGLVRWVIDLFSALMHGIEQALHMVDEAVSHHHGEGQMVMLTKALLGPLWRVLRNVIHFYATVLVEPQINPIKHFPVVTVSHKLMLPFLPTLTSAMLEVVNPVLPQIIGIPFVTVTILLLPGLFGFLAWELRANWRLYEANHTQRIQAAHFGPAGETMSTVLRRGFHSGALPKAFAGLRHVIVQEGGSQSHAPRAVRQAEARLKRILEAVQRFAHRELVFAIAERSRELGQPLLVTLVHLQAATASLTLRIVLAAAHEEAEAGPPSWLEIRLIVIDEQLSSKLKLSRIPPGFDNGEWLAEETNRFLARAGIRGPSALPLAA